MERDVACELWRKAPQSGVEFSINVGDDDSTTLADIRNKVPYGAKAMEKKVFYDKQQQEKKKFKIRHNQLS